MLNAYEHIEVHYSLQEARNKTAQEFFLRVVPVFHTSELRSKILAHLHEVVWVVLDNYHIWS